MDNLTIGSVVKINPDAVFLNNNKAVSKEILKLKVYIRDIKNNTCIIARAKTGPVLGTLNIDDVELYMPEDDYAIESYVVTTLEKNVPLYQRPSKGSSAIKKLNQFALITIIDEKNGFGKVKNGPGWIELSRTQIL